MSLKDRFICRREGHDPTFVVTTASPFVTSYICKCRRCGKYVQVKINA